MNLTLYPDPILSTRCSPIEDVSAWLADPATKATIPGMAALAVSRGGYAVAAPQVGLPARFFVFSVPAAEKFKVPQVWINPEINVIKGETTVLPEGCLSIPDVGTIRSYRPSYPEFRVERWTELQVSYFDQDGVERLTTVSGLLARVVQHEIDHLDGVLVTDRTVGAEHARAERYLHLLRKRRTVKV